jgi:hypothetical protein
MKKILCLIVLVAVAATVVGCGGTKTIELDQLEARDVQPPDWYLNVPESKTEIIAVGSFLSLDMQVAVDKATSACSKNLGKMVSLKLRTIESLMVEETGLHENAELIVEYKSAINTSTEQMLVGVKTKKKHIVKEGESYRAYVMMEMPVSVVEGSIVEVIKSHDSLKAVFGETKVFKEIGGE